MTSLARQYRTAVDARINSGSLAALVRELLRSGKVPELCSFLWWEALYRLKLLPTVQSADQPPVLSDPDWLAVNSPATGRSNPGFTIALSPEPWKLVSQGPGGDSYGCFHTTPEVLLQRPADGTVAEVHRFRCPIASLFVTELGTVLVSLFDGSTHRFDGRSRSCTKVLQLTTTESFVRFDSGVAETTRGLIAMAEYGNVREGGSWRSVANLYFSLDDGCQWECSNFFIEAGVNKHIHLLHYSPRLDALVVTVGDNRKQTWVGQLTDGLPPDNGVNWRRSSRGRTKTGGFTAAVEIDSNIIFGTDYHGGTNFVVASPDCRSMRKRALPDPYRRGPIYAMTTRHTDDGIEIWAASHNAVSRGARSLVMMSSDGGATWQRIIDYNGERYRVRFASSAAWGSPSSLYLYVTLVLEDDSESPVATLRIGQ
ncbi:MAG: hypothetical protein AAGA65_25365 [Actinomycetota bacterium]